MGATFWKFSGGEQFSKATPRWLHVLAPERSMEQTQAGEQEASGENAGGMSKQQVLRYRPANTTLSGRCLGDVWEMSPPEAPPRHLRPWPAFAQYCTMQALGVGLATRCLLHPLHAAPAVGRASSSRR